MYIVFKFIIVRTDLMKEIKMIRITDHAGRALYYLLEINYEALM